MSEYDDCKLQKRLLFPDQKCPALHELLVYTTLASRPGLIEILLQCEHCKIRKIGQIHEMNVPQSEVAYINVCEGRER